MHKKVMKTNINLNFKPSNVHGCNKNQESMVLGTGKRQNRVRFYIQDGNKAVLESGMYKKPGNFNLDF